MDDLLLFILILCLFFAILIYFNKDILDKNVIRVKSTVDGQVYLVRNLPNSQEAANLLAGYKQDIMKISNRLKEKYIDNKKDDSEKSLYLEDGVQRLFKNLKLNSISESDPYHKYKSMLINKGEELYICLRHTDERNYEFNDRQPTIFTICHEMAHATNKSIGHPPEFWEWHKVVCEAAADIGIYKPVDYSKHPVKYCGMTINSTPMIF